MHTFWRRGRSLLEIAATLDRVDRAGGAEAGDARDGVYSGGVEGVGEHGGGAGGADSAVVFEGVNQRKFATDAHGFTRIFFEGVMFIIDPHCHMVSRTTADYENMAIAGVVAISEPAFWAGYDRSPAGFVDYYRQLTETEPSARPALASSIIRGFV